MDIRDAILDPGNILPPFLAGYSAKLRPDGEAFAVKGGFALSVKIVKGGGKPLCLRCWTENSVNASQIDYLCDVTEIIRKNQDSRCPYFIDFRIVEKLLRVDGVELPGLLMDWVEGETLNKFVMANSGKSPSQIRQLATDFAKMCEVFNNRRIVHGDLSAVNIIVQANGALKVIDYDSLYSPSMGRRYQHIAGINDYQHPQRRHEKYYETYSDYFSQHVIYVALLILAHIPGLRPKENLKNLLFTESDFRSPSAFRKSIPAVKGRQLGLAEINSELDIIEKALGTSLAMIPGLQLTNRMKQHQLVEFCTACGKKFNNDDFLFCPSCGHKRLVIPNLL